MNETYRNMGFGSRGGGDANALPPAVKRRVYEVAKEVGLTNGDLVVRM